MNRIAFEFERYPHVVDPKNYGFFRRLVARIGLPVRVGEEDISGETVGIYLSYCSKHRIYYVDYPHDGYALLCPLCLKDRLLELLAILNKHREAFSPEKYELVKRILKDFAGGGVYV